MRKNLLTYDEALSIYRKAEALVAGAEYDVGTGEVLRLAQDSGCSAYDCEFVALAEHLDVKLISEDAGLCKAFPKRAALLSGAHGLIMSGSRKHAQRAFGCRSMEG